jgi:hypothetical protein
MPRTRGVHEQVIEGSVTRPERGRWSSRRKTDVPCGDRRHIIRVPVSRDGFPRLPTHGGSVLAEHESGSVDRDAAVCGSRICAEILRVPSPCMTVRGLSLAHTTSSRKRRPANGEKRHVPLAMLIPPALAVA